MRAEGDILIKHGVLCIIMAHGHGLINQSLNIDRVALGTLAARAAVILTSQFNNPTHSFLMKRARYFLQYIAREANDDGPILIGIAHGDANVAEIAAAMVERNVNGPDDITSVLDQDTAWVVYQNSVMPMEMYTNTEGQIRSFWFQPGGKKGIPLLEGSGCVLFAFNAGSSALSTAGLINGIAMIQGVWLRD